MPPPTTSAASPTTAATSHGGRDELSPGTPTGLSSMLEDVEDGAAVPTVPYMYGCCAGGRGADAAGPDEATAASTGDSAGALKG